VSKVHNEEELVQAAARASERHKTSPVQRSDFMIKPYIDGPEIDANVVLVDGEIAFCEVADDFPSLADGTDNKWHDPFQETAMVLPSKLPQAEIQLIRSALHQTLLRQGFRNGIFNCEGRVQYSSMRYENRNGQYDLFESDENTTEEKKPRFYLHEINARPSGY
jgi:biotin carboxylase